MSALAPRPMPTDPISVIKWNGKPISIPGVYDMSLEDYHSNCCAGPSISSSGLREIENKSPLHYWAGSYLNPKRAPDEEQKTHFNVGAAAHTLLLGESGFRDQYVVRPEKWDSWRTDASKVWKDEQVRAKRRVLVPSDLDVIRGMAESLMADQHIKDGLFNGLTEKSLIWKDEETGVWLKSRPDTIQADAAIIVDLKTCAAADWGSCQRSLDEYGYHMQLALAAMGMKALLGRDVPNDGCWIVFVEKRPPYAVNVKIIHGNALASGFHQIRRALNRFAHCWETKTWPGYADSGSFLTLPEWREKQLEAEFKAGRL